MEEKEVETSCLIGDNDKPISEKYATLRKQCDKAVECS